MAPHPEVVLPISCIQKMAREAVKAHREQATNPYERGTRPHKFWQAAADKALAEQVTEAA